MWNPIVDPYFCVTEFVNCTTCLLILSSSIESPWFFTANISRYLLLQLLEHKLRKVCFQLLELSKLVNWRCHKGLRGRIIALICISTNLARSVLTYLQSSPPFVPPLSPFSEQMYSGDLGSLKRIIEPMSCQWRM